MYEKTVIPNPEYPDEIAKMKKPDYMKANTSREAPGPNLQDVPRSEWKHEDKTNEASAVKAIGESMSMKDWVDMPPMFPKLK